MRYLQRHLDIFNQPISINFNREERFSTSMGLFFSISFVCFIITSGTYFLFELFERQNPNLLFHSDINVFPKQFTFNNNTLLVLSLQDFESMTPWYDSQIYTIQAVQRHLRIVNNSEDEPIHIIDQTVFQTSECDEIYFENFNHIRGINKIPKKNMICLKGDLKIGGNKDMGEYYEIQFHVERCKLNCKSEAEITKALKLNIFKVYTFGVNVEEQNLDHPASIMVQSFEAQISEKFPTIADLSFHTVQIKIDSGIVFHEQREFEEVSALEMTHSVVDIDKVMILSIEHDLSQESVKITYVKLQAIIGEIVGVAQLTFALIVIFYNPVLKQKFYKKLTHLNLYFQEQESEKMAIQKEFQVDSLIEKESTNKIQNQDKNNQQDRNNPPPQKSNYNNLIQNAPQTLIHDTGSKDKIELEQSFLPYINICSPTIPYFNHLEIQQDEAKADETQTQQQISDKSKIQKDALISKTQKKEIKNFTRDYFLKRCDLLDIIKRLDDLEKLKYLLLDEHQLILFNLTKCPKLVLEKTTNTIKLKAVFLLQSENGNSQDVMQALIALQQNKTKNNLIDQQLNKILDFGKIEKIIGPVQEQAPLKK